MPVDKQVIIGVTILIAKVTLISKSDTSYTFKSAHKTDFFLMKITIIYSYYFFKTSFCIVIVAKN